MFCCSGQDDSTTHKQQNNLSHTASNRSVVTQQPTSIRATISNNLSPQSTGVRSASHQQHQQRQQLQKKVQSRMSQHPRNKADVTIYEATDSSIDENQHKHDGATATVYEDSSKTDSQYEDADNEEEEEDADQDMDDYFDLTKLQPGQAHYPGSQWLLGPQPEHLKGRKCLILDLDETLVHSSFKFLRQADFVIPVDIDNQLHNVYVIKRPGVDEFMRRVGEIYEVVVFTASVSRYGDPLLDVLDIHKSIHHRLFRDSCFNYQNNYIKNLAQIGRPLSDIIILDNSPASYLFHPQHAIPISSWFSDAHDNELLDIMPFLEDLAKDNVEDIGMVLDINI